MFFDPLPARGAGSTIPVEVTIFFNGFPLVPPKVSIFPLNRALNGALHRLKCTSRNAPRSSSSLIIQPLDLDSSSECRAVVGVSGVVTFSLADPASRKGLVPRTGERSR